MTSARALVAAAGLLVTACGEPDPVTVVFVTVEAPPTVSEVESLEVTVRNAGAAVSDTFDIADTSFPLTFTVTPTGRTGELVVEARGEDRAGLLRAVGTARAAIVADQRVDATLLLVPADFVVNSNIAGEQRLFFASERAGRQAAAGPDGSFAVVFANDCALGRCDILARLYDPDARPRVNGTTMDDGELIANQTTEVTDSPAVAIGADGLFIAWETGDGVKGVALGPDGDHLGFSEVLVSSGFAALAPAVAALATGEYVVVWAEDRISGAGTVIRGRFIGSDGTPAVNPSTGDSFDFPITSATTGFDEVPTVSATGDGRGFVAVWRHRETSFGSSNVVGRFYGPNGGIVAAREGPLTAYADADVEAPQVAALPDGSAAVAWAVIDPGDPRLDDGGLLLGRFAPPLGVPVATEVVLAAPRQAFNTPALALRGDGAVAAAWHECGAGGDGQGCGVFLQAVRPSGLRVGDPLPVNTTLGDDQIDPSVAATGDAFVVAWSDASSAAPDTDKGAVRARVMYPAYDVSDGRRGASCGEAGDAACAEGLLCATGAEGRKLCHDACDPGASDPCPAGGFCTSAGGGTACVF